MLSKLFLSLKDLVLPHDYKFCLIVVDNNSLSGTKALVHALANRLPFSVIYHHEPEPGISVARNAVLRLASECHASWLACVDDDEEVTPLWLMQLLAAAQYHNADVVQGHVVKTYHEKQPFWVTARPHLREGDRKVHASTNNVLISARLFRDDGLGLRFDEKMNFSGSEDTDFFFRASARGATIVQTENAEVLDHFRGNRMSFLGQFLRTYRASANNFYIKQKHYGKLVFALRCFPKIIMNTLLGAFLLLVSPFLIIFGVNAFKTNALDGAKRLAKASGLSVGLMGFRPAPYRTVDGA